MTITQLSNGVPDSQSAGPELSDQEVENAALAGSAAIRQLIGERNELRKERERLCAVNNELRDQIGKVTRARDQYVQFASDVYAELNQIQLTIQSAFRKNQGLPTAPDKRDGHLIDLARRFSPPAGSQLQGKRD